MMNDASQLNSDGRLYLDPIWCDIASRVINAKDMAEVNKVSEQFTYELGCKYYSFTVRVAQSLIQPSLIVVTNMPNDWIQHYVDQGYFAIDPTLHNGETRLNPYTWQECGVNKLPATVHEALRQFGLSDGISVAQHGPHNALGIMSCVASTAIGENERTKFVKRLLLKNYAGLLFEKIQQLMVNVFIPNTHSNPLSAREKDCLRWAAEGKTSQEIGKIIGIAASTVVHHLRSAGLKLGAVKRQGAVTAALASGYLEYDWQEAADKNIHIVSTGTQISAEKTS